MSLGNVTRVRWASQSQDLLTKKLSDLMNRLRSRESRGNRDYLMAEVLEVIDVRSVCDPWFVMAGSQGFFHARFRKPNKHGHYSLTPNATNDLLSSIGGIGCRLVSILFGFSWRDVTQNVTHREPLGGSCNRRPYVDAFEPFSQR